MLQQAIRQFRYSRTVIIIQQVKQKNSPKYKVSKLILKRTGDARHTQPRHALPCTKPQVAESIQTTKVRKSKLQLLRPQADTSSLQEYINHEMHTNKKLLKDYYKVSQFQNVPYILAGKPIIITKNKQGFVHF